MVVHSRAGSYLLRWEVIRFLLLRKASRRQERDLSSIVSLSC